MLRSRKTGLAASAAVTVSPGPTSDGCGGEDLVACVKPQEQLAQERLDALQTVSDELKALRELSGEVQELLKQQAPDVTRIEQHTAEASEHSKLGHINLTEAARLVGSRRVLLAVGGGVIGALIGGPLGALAGAKGALLAGAGAALVGAGVGAMQR